VKNHCAANVVFLKKELPDHQEAATRLNAPIDLKPRHTTPGRTTVVHSPWTSVNVLRVSEFQAPVYAPSHGRVRLVYERPLPRVRPRRAYPLVCSHVTPSGPLRACTRLGASVQRPRSSTSFALNTGDKS